MSSRRLDISSLLCTDESPVSSHPPSQSPPHQPVPEPVILAPHLRNSHIQRLSHHPLEHVATSPSYSNDPHDHATDHPRLVKRRTSSPNSTHDPGSHSSRRRTYPEYVEDSEMDPPRSYHPNHSSHDHRPRQPETHYQQLHRPTHQHHQPIPSDPAYHSYPSRPSSSRSLSQSPMVSSLFPIPRGTVSPTLSPVSPYPHSAPHDRFTYSATATSQRGSSSPMLLYQNSSLPHQLQRPHSSSLSSHSPPLPPPQHHPRPSTSNHYPDIVPTSQSRRHSNPSPTNSSSFAPPPSSSTSLPPISPTLAKGKSPFLGLEALVHVASVERRRLSAGSERSSADEIRMSTSPVTEDFKNREHHRDVYQASSQPRVQGRVVAYPDGPGPGDGGYIHGGTDAVDFRPYKRRRRSPSGSVDMDRGGYTSLSASEDERDRHATHYTRPYGPAHESERFSPVALTGPGSHGQPVMGDQLQFEKERKGRYGYSPSFDHHDARVREEAKIPPSGHRPGSKAKPLESSDVKSQEELYQKDKEHKLDGDVKVVKEVKKKAHSRSKAAKDVVPSPEKWVVKPKDPEIVMPRPQKQEQPAEQDPHEWFLRQYDSSPPRPSAALPAPLAKRAPSASSTKHRTPTPEAVADLERELEQVAGTAGDDTLKDENDVEITLADATEERRDGGMEVDVEDELLSLVDDRPPVHRPLATVPQTLLKGVAANRQPSVPLSVKSKASPSPFVPGPLTTGSPSVSTPIHERGSMPPPISTSVSAPGRGSSEVMERSGTSVKKKKNKEATSKPAAKPKAPAKPRGKPGPKPKPKNADGTSSATSKGAKASPLPTSKKIATATTTSRSRSASIMPANIADEESKMEVDKDVEEGEEKPDEDDKLYCVCKTKYDEDRVMIACDRCDEWYHTQCVDMPDLEVDLVDQFICPPCIASNPHLSLRTTYKKRCLLGLKHPDPSSPSACHKPSRGAFSKYCSDECGVKYMQSRIDSWSKKGGKKDKLLETVKGAEKREGVVVCAEEDVYETKMDVDGDESVCKPQVSGKGKKTNVEREVEQLNVQLDRMVQEREQLKKDMEVILWRERLTELASERAEKLDVCGWDQRLCFGDEEWADFGAGVLESYEEKDDSGESMVVDATAEGDGEWWCPGKKKCDRHAGWQKLRSAEVLFEKEMKETALSKLTTREREIRKRIEDTIDPQSSRSANEASAKAPLKSSNVKPSVNGHSKPKVNGEVKKGKKRKASVA